MRIERFEDLEVWKLSREITHRIYSITESDKFIRDFDLKRQIRRASISVMANISEGFERRSNKEFVQFLFIAKGSAGEVRSQLYVARDLNYISNIDFKDLKDKIEIISKSLSGFIKYLRTI